jgi:UDP-glucose 4-epimerase
MSGTTPAWVVGSGGLLGGAVVRRLVAEGRPVLVSKVPWTDEQAALTSLRAGLRAVVEQAAGRPWDLVWCAGSGVTSTTALHLDAEVAMLRQFVELAVGGQGGDLSAVAVFVASSAGGIYAGAQDPPFDEHTAPAPLSSYGHAKLRAEAELSRLATVGGAKVLVGRMSNLYGPGQNLAKAQGLISQLCRSQLLSQPIGVYVSLDTMRDYLFVDDAADLVIEGLGALRERAAGGEVVMKILASQRSASVAAVLGEVRRIFKRRPLLQLAASTHSLQQARDLRFRSVVWPDLDARPLTPLPVGISATAGDIARRIRSGELAASRR